MEQLQTVSVDKPHGIRAVGIVLNGNQLLVIRRVQDRQEYFTFPGGGVKVCETIEEAVLREIMEETGITVSILRLVYHHDLIEDSDQYFYTCRYLSGTPVLGGEELEKTRQGDIYDPCWIPLQDLSTVILFPLEVRDWLLEDYKNGFPAEPRVLSVRPEQLR